ncbi:MAG: glycerol-3-phosphate dehydrogenase [Hyphomicrobium sp.]
MYDIAIIGGGVNGCGIARDAQGRGLKVLLVEKGDLASGTSSASTKLVHGGLRYLEHYEFRMVREALQEREVLLSIAPHIIWPLRFVLPHHEALRPTWLIRLGLFMYDHLGGRKILPASRQISLAGNEAGAPLAGRFTRAFEYSDCWVDDARLVVLNALDAKERGADILTRTEAVSVTEGPSSWRLDLDDKRTGAKRSVQARALINAAGPWVDDVLNRRLGSNRERRIRLVKGSHIVVAKLFDHDKAYIFQNADRRIVFAIPYENDFTLIGTTDVDYTGDPGAVAITSDEVDYLCSAVSEYFKRPITPGDVVWTYSGVRPLMDDGSGAAQEATRDYMLERNESRSGPALLNIFGGKITTYRRLSDDAMGLLSDIFGTRAPWTGQQPLPGGDMPIDGARDLAAELQRRAPDLTPATARRLARTYGTRAKNFVGGNAAQSGDTAGLGIDFGAGLSEREVRYLIAHEWAVTADDILWRRTKMGLRLSATQRDALEKWLSAEHMRVA